jgi:hypothetical protein
MEKEKRCLCFETVMEGGGDWEEDVRYVIIVL